MFKYYLILLNKRHTYYVGLHFCHKLLERLFQRYQTPQMYLQRNNVQEIYISFYESSKVFEFLAFASDRQVCKSLFKGKGWKYFTFKGLLKWLLVVLGLFKVNLEFSFSFLDYFIPRSGFQTWDFFLYFNFNFTLFLSNCWLLVSLWFTTKLSNQTQVFNFFLSKLCIALLLRNQESGFSFLIKVP